ncbi:MAG: hypothetical protein KBD64_01485, partial [Gammaproteobacteria bacterium]|nr:hypothetical protein [Gammaproteobacteria bacterium]
MNIQKAHEILKLKSQDTPYTKEEIDRMFRTLASKHHSDQDSGKSQRVREIEGKLGKKLKRDVRRKLESEKKNLEKAIAGHKREFQRLSDARSRLLTLDTGIVGAVSATEVNTKLEEYLIQSLGDFKTPKLLGAKYDKKKFTWTLKTSKINLAAIDVTQRKKVLMWLAVNIVAGRLTQNHVAFIGVPSDLSEAEKFLITFIQIRVYQSKLSRMVRSMVSKIQEFFGRGSISLPLSVLAIICPIVTIVLLIVLPHSVPLSIVFCVVSLLPFIVNFLNGIR